jgi:predicted nucleic acid-binding protein
MGKKKVVLDTNVLISALGFDGPERVLVRRCIAGELQLCIT